MPASVCRGRAKPRVRAQLVSILIVVGTCTRSCARVRVSRQGEAACPRVAAKPPPLRRRLATALRPGTASLYINVVGTCTRSCARVRVSRLFRRAEPRAAKPAACRGRAARGVSACRGEATLRLIDPRKLYSILRPGSINRSIINNPIYAS